MTICNDKHHDKPSSSHQIFVHVRESETPMRDVRSLMLEVLMQYQQLDKIGFAMGIQDKAASFSDSIAWCAILGKLDHAKNSLDKVSKEHLVKSVDYLDELVSGFKEQVVIPIQQQRDKWMRKVLLRDLLLLVLITSVICAALYWTGTGFDKKTYLDFMQQRPLFSTLMVAGGGVLLVGLHFIVRQKVLNQMLEKIDSRLPAGMSLLKSLSRNARVRHSIFRPDPVGWNFRQKKHLQTIADKMTDLREQLDAVLENYPDKQAA